MLRLDNLMFENSGAEEHGLIMGCLKEWKYFGNGRKVWGAFQNVAQEDCHSAGVPSQRAFPRVFLP
jgi:hypothetical protein